MKIEFIPSDREGRFKNIFSECLQTSQSLDWAVAFGQKSAFDILEGEFEKFFKNGGKSRAVFDLSSGLTDPSLIEELITYPGESHCRVYCGALESTGIFHHKIYIFKSSKNYKVIIGSFNFSKSAFYKNFESCTYIEGSKENGFIKSVVDYFENDVWNSTSIVSPEASEDILEIYKKLHRKNNEGRKAKNQITKRLEKILFNITKIQLNQSKINIYLAYLYGVVCANTASIKGSDLADRKIKIVFKSNKKNMGTDEESFICVKIDDKILGDIKLPQYETQKRNFSRIYKEIKKFISWDSKDNKINFTDNTRHQINFKCTIEFSENSKIFPHLLHIISNEFDRKVDLNGDIFYLPTIPKSVLNSKDINILTHYLRGYFDFRSRISKSDKLPTSGKLRVAVQVSKDAENFGKELKETLNNHFGIEAGFAGGKKRNRDNMVRMYPTDQLLKFWSNGYDKLLIKAFIDYNQQFNLGHA